MGLFSSNFRAMEITHAHGISPPQNATKDKRKKQYQALPWIDRPAHTIYLTMGKNHLFQHFPS